MKFLLDHDVPDALARVITQSGHTAQRLRDLLPRDTDDISILKFACDKQAVLVRLSSRLREDG